MKNPIKSINIYGNEETIKKINSDLFITIANNDISKKDISINDKINYLKDIKSFINTVDTKSNLNC